MKPLPDTRKGLTKKGTVGKVEFYVTVNFYEDNNPCEVFCKVAKQGSTVSGLVDSIITTLNIALRYGAPWPLIMEKYKGHQFEPRDDTYSSFIDALADNIDQAIIQHRSLWDDATVETT